MNTIVADGHRISFDRYMEGALYHPETGYYRQAPENILGRDGDFYTASQLQPTFGVLVSALLPDAPVLELGAGRGEMRASLAPRPYLALGIDDPLPADWRGTIFANEFFDALPVVAGIRQDGRLRELYVERSGCSHQWITGPVLSAKREQYVHTYYPDLPEGARFEIAERAVDWIRRIHQCLVSGTVFIVDYGWSSNEYLRFPLGTLMSYRRHLASPDVLSAPGRQDITAHVPFPALIDAARQLGFQVVRFETLSQTLLDALKLVPHLMDNVRHRPQLKTLLYGMGQSFRTLILQKEGAK